MRPFVLSCFLIGMLLFEPPRCLEAADWPKVVTVDRQPLQAATARLVEALRGTGAPLDPASLSKLQALQEDLSDTNVCESIQQILDPLCIAAVQINPESRVHVVAGPVKPTLIEKGWQTFLVKVVNEGGVTATMRCTSPQALPMMVASSSKSKPESRISPAESERRWLDIALLNGEPLRASLSGLGLEYRVVQLYARDAGKREATLQFDVGQGTQDLGFRNELPLLFDCRASKAIKLSILDWDGKPTTCSLLIKDEQSRVYPNPSRRLAPDFFFHHQIYRNHGETVQLPGGKYDVVAYRGPEYLPVRMKLEVDDVADRDQTLSVRLERWIHMAEQGWISGDHHVHAAGCAHYENPTQGVTPEDMMRHIVGEDLNIGCVLSWGPCWYYQKQFFDGQTSKLSQQNHLMRYDVEVSGFPSSHAGHLCLLNLKEDDYPGTSTIEEWPSWTLPVLRWGKEQGGVVGYSHSGWGLALPDYLPNGQRGLIPKIYGGAASPTPSRAADKLPDYAMPPFDGIGANEYIVAVVHDVCDFISSVDTPAVWELNIWYHTLNCGYRTRISGETDFPCIYGERVGLGRVYVEMPTNVPLTYEPWVQGLRDGRSYVGDGACHITEFSVNGLGMGHRGESGVASELKLSKPGRVTISTQIAAMLPKEISPEAQTIRNRRIDEKPYWHIERSRIGETRKVPVELVMNGEVVATREIEADGKTVDIDWEIDLTKSSWVALRVFPSMHSNPIFVEIDNQPIRSSVESAEWCRKAVDICWNKKKPQIRAAEREAAEAAYEIARKAYDRIMEEAKSR